jgi:penicillin-binding protein 1A
MGVAASVLVACLVLPIPVAIGAEIILFQPAEMLPKIDAASQAKTTEIRSSDGTLLAEWHGEIDRQPVALSSMSKYLEYAAIAAEDNRFFQRGAVDLLALLRAFIANVREGALVQGGSTITQQYAKNAYVGNERTLSRKIREIRVAYRLEQSLSKKKILEDYLNNVYFGRGTYGVQAAARSYFGKPASRLNASESALLIGLIRSPTAYSPDAHPSAAEARREWVIGRMMQLGSLSARQADEAGKHPPTIVARPGSQSRYDWFMDAVRTYLVRRYGAEKVYSGGLKVEVTVDPQAQAAAEATASDALPDRSDPHASIVSVDPKTGYVIAMVGGKDYVQEKYNIAVQGRRQPGSAFKPFVLVAALEQGISTQTVYRAPSTIRLNEWKPLFKVSNFDQAGYGSMTLEQATIHSVNTVYAQLVLQVGPAKVVDVARRMGIPGPRWLPARGQCHATAADPCRTKLDAVPSLALGSEEVTPLELASAYATLAAGGVYREPKLVSRVVDGDGHVLEEGPSQGRQVISPTVAATVTHILEEVITKGTARNADIGRPAAGKTGTAQGFRNAWFSGYTGDVATAIWLGFRDTNRPLLDIHGVKRVTGGSIPAEMWREYMKAVLDKAPPTTTLDKEFKDGQATRNNVPVLAGSAADSDGVVERVEGSVDGGPFSADGIACTGCPGPKVAWSFTSPATLPDGRHDLRFRSIDKAGHESELAAWTVTVDTAPPTIRAITSTGGSPEVEATFSEPISCADVHPSAMVALVDGSDGTVKSVRCDGESNPVLNLTLDKPVRGGDLVTVDVGGRAPTDAAGNPAAPHPATVSATNKLPLVALDERQSNAPVSPGRVNASGSAADPDGVVTGVEASIDDRPFTADGVSCLGCGKQGQVTWTYKPTSSLSDGRHRLAFRTLDNAKTFSAPALRGVAVDAVPPALRSLKATGGSPEVEATFSEPVSCPGLGASGLVATTGGSQAAPRSVRCEGESNAILHLILPKPVRGGDLVTVDAAGSGAPSDPAGNPAAHHETSVHATNVAPAVTVSAEGSGLPTNSMRASILGTGADPDGVVQAAEVSFDGGPFSSLGIACQGCGNQAQVSFTYRPTQILSNGTHSLAFRTVDNAGVPSIPGTRNLYIDEVPPALQTIAAEGGVPFATAIFSEPLSCATVGPSDFRVRFSGTPVGLGAVDCQGDSDATIQLALARAPVGGEDVLVSLNTPNGGSARLVDVAGNPAPVTTGIAKATNSHPVLNVIPPLPGGPAGASAPAAGAGATWTGTASDPDGIVQVVEASLDGGPYSAQDVTCPLCGNQRQVTFTFTMAADSAPGSHRVNFRAVDGAGLTSNDVRSSAGISAFSGKGDGTPTNCKGHRIWGWCALAG